MGLKMDSNRQPTFSEILYTIREEGMFVPDPTAPDFRGTDTPQANYRSVSPVHNQTSIPEPP